MPKVRVTLVERPEEPPRRVQLKVTGGKTLGPPEGYEPTIVRKSEIMPRALPALPAPADAASDEQAALVVETKILGFLRRADEVLAEADAHAAKSIMVAAAAAETYARQTDLGKTLMTRARALKRRAEVRLGELLSATDKANGGQYGGRTASDGTRAAPSNPPSKLADLGISKRLSSESQRLAALPPETQEQYFDGLMSTREALRAAETRHREQAEEIVRWILRTASGFREVTAATVPDARKVVLEATPEQLAEIRSTAPELAKFFQALANAAASFHSDDGGSRSLN